MFLLKKWILLNYILQIKRVLIRTRRFIEGDRVYIEDKMQKNFEAILDCTNGELEARTGLSALIRMSRGALALVPKLVFDLYCAYHWPSRAVTPPLIYTRCHQFRHTADGRSLRTITTMSHGSDAICVFRFRPEMRGSIWSRATLDRDPRIERIFVPSFPLPPPLPPTARRQRDEKCSASINPTFSRW